MTTRNTIAQSVRVGNSVWAELDDGSLFSVNGRYIIRVMQNDDGSTGAVINGIRRIIKQPLVSTIDSISASFKSGAGSELCEAFLNNLEKAEW